MRSSSSKPILYSAWFCPYAQRVWAGLHHFDVDFELIESLGSGMQPKYTKLPELLIANPQGLVPTLVYPNNSKDTIKCESIDILKDLYQERTPQKEEELSELYQEAKLWNQKVCSPYYRVLVKPDQAGRREGWKDMLAGLTAFSKLLQWEETGGETRTISFYDCKGNSQDDSKPSLVDFTVFPWIHRLCVIEVYRNFRLVDGVPGDVYEKIESWTKKMEALPAVQKTLANRTALIDSYKRYADGVVQSKVGEAVRQGKEAHNI
mmetsp:Transcript_21143/g.38270  ORF Transcript_21143/g.38270 Transcript_21143/m.38270 type:complete len:263 (-) Transcript_21143:187-975(-)|eukprot:CAMPEP_0201886326 /NCGR_PEP_ID=MMETSP0902-20130614/21789_1 /ASSEMBLY_ACC=CAM_ASM_000551 /TAXON_ID=420261 /ORGANISM="Thalassiosira antarctica, Strain CCMP982" /LENGTH=262 /DNA_ID=CAMNT_0048415867 /DNA_START=112 /DNA_END=900 /DNA_ORIENTATION=+